MAQAPNPFAALQGSAVVTGANERVVKQGM